MDTLLTHLFGQYPLAAGALELLLPAVLGWLAWRWMSGGRGRVRGICALAALATVGLAAWAIPHLRIVSPYDVMLPAVLLALAILVGACRGGRESPPWQAWAASAMTLAIGIAGLEAYCRRHPERQVIAVERHFMPLTFPDEIREFGFDALYPERSGRRFPKDFGPPSRWPRTPGVRRVLHVGDSVVGAGDTPPGTSFEEVLAKSVGGEHVNLGTSNTGPDFELQVLRTWVDRLRPDEVVLHVYSGNDIAEVDRPYLYCDDGPLLGPLADGLPWRCPEPSFRITRRRLLSQGPSPLALRLAAPYSALAHRMLGCFERAIRKIPAPGRAAQSDEEHNWTRYRACLAAARDEMARRAVPFHVVVLPDPKVVEPGPVEPSLEANARRALEIARAVGINPLDPTGALKEAIAKRPQGGWYVESSPHFYVDGHAFYAAWLAGQLGWSQPASREGR